MEKNTLGFSSGETGLLLTGERAPRLKYERGVSMRHPGWQVSRRVKWLQEKEKEKLASFQIPEHLVKCELVSLHTARKKSVFEYRKAVNSTSGTRLSLARNRETSFISCP